VYPFLLVHLEKAIRLCERECVITNYILLVTNDKASQSDLF